MALAPKMNERMKGSLRSKMREHLRTMSVPDSEKESATIMHHILKSSELLKVMKEVGKLGA